MAHDVRLNQITGGADAKWGIVSLPIPGDARYSVQVQGSESQSVPVGFWPRSEEKPGGPRKPRRSLVFFARDGVGTHPTVRLTEGDADDSDSSTGKWSVEARIVEKHHDKADEQNWCFYKEDGEAVLRFGDSESAIRLGVRNEFGMHWWQYVIAEKLWGGPVCEAWRVGGHIYLGEERIMAREEIKGVGNITTYPDNTEAASVYLLLFNDGTVQVTAHWINGRIYGGYGNHRGMPIVAFRTADGVERQWTGEDPVLEVGDAVADLSPAAHLVSDEHPGSLAKADGLQVWQPFESTLITIRHLPNEDGTIRDITIDHSEEGLFQGTARSVPWLMKLGGGEPSVARYLAPREWYAANCEFAPFAVEVQEGEFTRLSKIAAEGLLRNSVKGVFTSGGIYRYLDQMGKGTIELSMDANECRSLFRRSYWDDDPRFYDLAMRNAYFCADIATDHSRDLIHYHGDKYPWLTYSLIYMRFSGIVLGYLETGDPYLLETAEAVARNYMSQHSQNWPRKGIGRDADPLTGFMILWDYTGKEEYFEFARRFAGDVAKVVMEDGSWFSGSGVGPLMGCNADIGSAWNGGHFMSGFTEYVMRDPDVPADMLEAGGRALTKLYATLDKVGGFHPAATGFAGRIHWYLSCRLGDEELQARTRQYMENLLGREHAEDEVLFSGGRAHHMNNYVDNLLFYQCTKDSLPEMLETGGERAYPLIG